MNDIDPEMISPERLENNDHAKYNKPRLTAHRAAFHDETCMMGSSIDEWLAKSNAGGEKNETGKHQDRNTW